jgi:hypothetical protein
MTLLALRLLGVFANWLLLAYGYTFPAFYVAFLPYLYFRGLWLLCKSGRVRLPGCSAARGD